MSEEEIKEIKTQMSEELDRLNKLYKSCSDEDEYYELKMQIVELEASIEQFNEEFC